MRNAANSKTDRKVRQAKYIVEVHSSFAVYLRGGGPASVETPLINSNEQEDQVSFLQPSVAPTHPPPAHSNQHSDPHLMQASEPNLPWYQYTQTSLPSHLPPSQLRLRTSQRPRSSQASSRPFPSYQLDPIDACDRTPRQHLIETRRNGGTEAVRDRGPGGRVCRVPPFGVGAFGGDSLNGGGSFGEGMAVLGLGIKEFVSGCTYEDPRFLESPAHIREAL